jgi:plasmid maintenance system killer protein
MARRINPAVCKAFSWSLTVTGNWRLIFRYEETTNTADDLDLIDYH